MARWSDMAGRLPAVLAGTGTVFVAATAFVLAYGGSKGAALDAGISPDAAGWYPLCIEGALVVASVSTVILRGRDRFAAWVVLLLFVAVSTAANVLHSIDHGAGHWWSPYAAAVPPLSLPICTWLAERVALATLHHPKIADGRAALPVAGPDSAGPVVPPGWAGGPDVDALPGGRRVHPTTVTPPAPRTSTRRRPVHRIAGWTPRRRPLPRSVQSSTRVQVDRTVDAPQDVHPPAVDAGQDRTRGTSTSPKRRRGGQDKTGRRPAKADQARDIMAELGVTRSRAYVLADDPAALARVRAARASLNGHTPVGTP